MTIVNSILRADTSFFLFREPGEAEARMGVCGKAPRRIDLASGFAPSPGLAEGMLVAPFDPSQPAWLMEAERVERVAIGALTISPVSGSVAASAEATDPADYLCQCRAFIDAIRAGKAEKAILAREVFTDRMHRDEAFVYFCKLAVAYPDAFVSLIHLPEAGTWLGATPELLLSVDADGHFETMSLAGTKPTAVPAYLRVDAWPEKERREQAIVTEYIADVLRASQIAFTQAATDVLRAGTVLHLCTRFGGRVAANQLPGLIRALHPTPAVCGRPLADALQLIAREEHLKRSLYAGYLGYVASEAGTRLYVNLRCARLTDAGAHLYVGGGITADSDPQHEWEETCLKAQTLLNPIL